MRTVRLEPRAADALDAAGCDPGLRRVEHAYQGLEWRLARTPNSGIFRSGYWVYKQLGFVALKIPHIVCVHRFDDDLVTIRFLLFHL